MPKVIDHTGRRFGCLKVLFLDGRIGNDLACVVECDCGTIKRIVQSRLTRKHKASKSCGCLSRINHHKTHEMTSHPFYPIWRAMRNRCLSPSNKSYKSYGGRGISICDDWMNSPEAFIGWLESNGYQKGMQIDRVDNNSDYSPGNCQVATRSENCRNRRTSRLVEYLGRKVTIAELAEIAGQSYSRIYARLFNYNYTPEQAVSGVKV